MRWDIDTASMYEVNHFDHYVDPEVRGDETPDTALNALQYEPHFYAIKHHYDGQGGEITQQRCDQWACGTVVNVALFHVNDGDIIGQWSSAIGVEVELQVGCRNGDVLGPCANGGCHGFADQRAVINDEKAETRYR